MYVLTPALDAPDMLHLNPRTGQEDGCGGRKWGTGSIETDAIIAEPISKAAALELLDSGAAIACRRCDLRDRAPATPLIAEQAAG